MRYLLDTHALVWLLSSQDSKLPRDLYESILYCEDAFFVSDITLIEIIQLQQLGKISLNYSPTSIRGIIEQNNIMILPTTTDILEVFYALSIPVINGTRHTDPFDRIIISTALKRGMTLVSADQKFPWYTNKYPLILREVLSAVLSCSPLKTIYKNPRIAWRLGFCFYFRTAHCVHMHSYLLNSKNELMTKKRVRFYEI